jgi:predicted component of type VI protein secretion system
MLSLTVTSYLHTALANPPMIRFDRTGGSIGRAADNDWVLDDPEQHVSRWHCRIDCREGRYIITDTSRHGVYLNGVGPLGTDRTAVLHDGDRLVIGDYEIIVRISMEPPPPPDPAQQLDGEELFRAFLEGAGGLRLNGVAPEEVMRRAGAMLLAVVEGVYALQKTRGETIRQFGIPQTMIQAADNSHFKILPDPDEALRAMLGTEHPGCLPAVDTLRLEFKKIEAHEIATFVAINEAVKKLIAVFDPEGLRKQGEPWSALDAILANWNAKTWETYQQLYRRQMSGEVFWRDFARAYEEQIKKL